MNTIYKGRKLPFALRAGDIIMFRNELELAHPSTYLSTSIRLATKFPYNHSGIITLSEDRLYINEALGNGIIKRPLNNYDGHNYLERDVETYIAILRPRVPVNPTEITIKADSYLGVKYDKIALVFHHLPYRLRGKWYGSTGIHADDKLVCSEYVQLVHNRPEFWLASTKEVFKDSFYDLIWEEKRFLDRKALIPSWE